MEIYVFLYQNLKFDIDAIKVLKVKIYVFLYQNLKKKEIVREASIKNIYVFLYQNLKSDWFFFPINSFLFMYFYIRI